MPLGDDDVVEDNAIKEIVKYLERESADVFYISNNFYDSDLIKKNKISDPFFKDIGLDRYFKNGHELFKCTSEIFGGISGICIKRSCWNKANPSKYAPQYGGFCAYGAAIGAKFPVDPTVFAVVDNKLYVNNSAGVSKIWTAKQSKAITLADNKWSKIRSTSAGDLAPDDDLEDE